MATTKITDLTAYTDPVSTDVLPIVDVTSDVTKKVSIADLMENAGSGSAAAPGISFDGDPNTGIYRPGADQVAISTNGTGRLFVDASGNVGVGVASPVTTLHLQKSTGGMAGIQISTSTHGSTLTDGLFVGIDNSIGYLYNYENLPLVFGTNSTERLRITSDGKVGLGTSSPLTQTHIVNNGGLGTPIDSLRVQSEGAYFNVRISPAANPTDALTTLTAYSGGGGNSSNSAFAFNTRTSGTESEKVRIDSSGRVGIGTSSPSYKLEVGTTSDASNHISIKTSTTGAAHFYFSDTNNGQAGIGYDHSTDKLTIRSNDAVAITCDSSQRVGIGTTSPGYLLSCATSADGVDGVVVESPSLNGQIRLRADGTNGNAIRVGGVGAQGNTLRFLVGSDTERARIDSSGRLLVGTSSARSNFDGNTATPLFQIEGVTAATASASIVRGANDSTGSTFNLGKTRGAAVGGNTVVSSGDQVGIINFQAADGTNLIDAASIQAAVDGTPGTDDMPGRLVFSTTADSASSPTERIRITSNGRAVFGGLTTTTGLTTSNILVGTSNSTTGAVGIEGYTTITTERFHASFANGNGVVGSISTNGSATAFNTSSDYRLKENVVPLTGAADRVNQLQVHRFNFIADPDKTVDGFIAHEAQAVVPECVTGTKDEVDEDGNPVYQGIDQSKLVPLLTAALQEALTKIETLEARLDAANL